MRLILLVVFACWSGLSMATDYYVGGTGASDSNPGTSAQPFATIQKAASVAKSGDVVKIRAGVYRETVTPGSSGVTFEADNGAAAVISGLNAATGSWTVHSGAIYKLSIRLPLDNNFQEDNGGSNTTPLANQVFKDGEMQHLARWPKVSTMDDLFDKTKFRGLSKMQSFAVNSLTDNGLPSIPGGYVGAYVSINGWFLTQTRQITSQSGNTLNYANVIEVNGEKFRKFYYVTNKLGLLTQAKEWHYEAGTLYFWQEGGGVPTGVEYKARNWGFDIRGKSNITVRGIQFIGCDPVVGDGSSTNTLVDNIRAKYINHSFIHSNSGGDYTKSAIQSGIKLLGANSTIKNSEIYYAGAHGIWLGPNCRAENNLLVDMVYDGMWGAPFKPWNADDAQVITKNTVIRSGRGAVELHSGGQANLNMEISYNDFSKFSTLSIDGGAVYSGLNTDLTGIRIHHNWFHDTGINRIEGVDGVQVTGVYLDQASGPATIDHNVTWNGDECDYYAEIKNYARDNGGSNLYNNTFGGTDRNYITYATPARADVQRNNIYLGNITVTNGNIANSILKGVNPMFVGNGTSGLIYRLQSGSPAINNGITIPGITDGSVGAPDIGAYEFGGTDWVAGYKAVPLTTIPSTNTPPTVTITAPANNTSVVLGTAVTITANAADANGSVSRVEFYDGTTKIGEDLTSPYSFSYARPLAGTHSITAKATDNENSVTTSAAITLVVTNPANANPTVSITSPANNSNAVAGTALNLNAVAADTDGTVAKVEFYDGATKLGEDLSSPYAFAWNSPSVGAHTITAKATDNLNAVTTSAAVSITITAASTPANAKPTVSITAPANNSSFTTGVNMTITAIAADTDGTVAKVEFYDGATKLGEDPSSPYTFTWNSPSVGAHTITAKATDNLNAVTTSTAVSITITAASTPVNAKPTVSITGPTNKSSFTTGVNLTITAIAADTDGTIAKVEFYQGATKLGEDTSSPYSFVWNNIPTGNYSITAVATDNLSATTTSVAVNVSISEAVVPANAAPTISLSVENQGEEFLVGDTVRFDAVAADTDGSIVKVEFFQGTTKLGEDSQAPYSFTWIGAPVGDFIVTAVATDNAGATATSESIDIQIIDPVSGGGGEDYVSAIPRFFSPNGDGIGDTWTWDNPEVYQNSLLSVYNRAGQKVYEAVSYNNTWDGTSNGRALADGDYYYVLKLVDLTVLKGAVRIIR